MRMIRTRTIACAVAMAAVLSLAPLRAQTTQTALSKEAGTVSDKFAGLGRFRPSFEICSCTPTRT
jgi:hypothetical protein